MCNEPSAAPAEPVAAAKARTLPPGGGGSYREILKSSAVVGGASLINIAIGVVRTKAMAVLLGPAGFGLMGAYLLIVELARSVAQLGVNASGVRQIAEAVGTGDLERTSRTAAVLRATAFVSAVLGAVALVLLAPVVSEVTFGSALHATDVALLSAAVFFGLIAGGQVALVQGMRRIADLSKIGILGSAFGTVASIVLVYFLRERGIVLSMIAVAALSVATGWWYRRKIALPRASLTVAQLMSESSALLKLGFAFMASGLFMLGASYIVRVLVLRHSGLEAAGLYQAAWTLGGLYVGFILQAMGADFYPRLVGAIADRGASNRLVNDQTRISLLLAGPGVIATLAFAPLIVSAFYSAKFSGAIEVLRWICLGMALRVITWPIGFIVVASDRRALFFVTELAWASVNVLLSWICVSRFGVQGAGIAFFLSYVFHGLMIYPVVRRLTGFSWSAANQRAGAFFVGSIAFVFVAVQFLPPMWAMAFGACAALVSSVYSVRALTSLFSMDEIPRPVRRLLTLLQFTPRGSDGSTQDGVRHGRP